MLPLDNFALGNLSIHPAELIFLIDCCKELGRSRLRCLATRDIHEIWQVCYILFFLGRLRLEVVSFNLHPWLTSFGRFTIILKLLDARLRDDRSLLITLLSSLENFLHSILINHLGSSSSRCIGIWSILFTFCYLWIADFLGHLISCIINWGHLRNRLNKDILFISCMNPVLLARFLWRLLLEGTLNCAFHVFFELLLLIRC